ncbi:membrane protein [Desulfoluna limicola]|uniref:Membrane protein n=1 Tax=Desulfoluna limicola TaxID=2810562 RepID=A0ABM7PEX7_9BACT|nr:trimeric intracellular cation channel family protein [Desulfoluna limicola]BCS95727.1 membrane protein [Desulfoluna limicola]
MILHHLYILGITVEAITGALKAGTKKMDVFGVIIIACATAIGGGNIRDMLLGNYPISWVGHPEYIVITTCAALITILLSPFMKYFHRVFLILDALGLVTFTIIGVRMTLALGHGFIVASIMGVITGVSGGIIRDVLCRDIPLVFQKEVYAGVSIVSAWLFLFLHARGMTELSAILITLATGFSLRLLAIYCNLEIPKFNYTQSQ